MAFLGILAALPPLSPARPPRHPPGALATCASPGIGKATATGLARWGARVTLVVRNPAKGEQTMADIRAQVPGAFALVNQTIYR